MTTSSRIKRLAIAIAVVAVAGLAVVPTESVAQSPSDEIRALLEERDADIKRLLDSAGAEDERRSRLMNVINGIIDFDALGREALGTHWDGLTPGQRSEFVSVFSDIVRRQSVADLDVYRSNVHYREIAVSGSTALVETVTTYREADTPVVYEMHVSDGSWMITDIVLDEVSTVEGYARSFQSLIRKRGFDTLMEKLREKRDAASSERTE